MWTIIGRVLTRIRATLPVDHYLRGYPSQLKCILKYFYYPYVRIKSIQYVFRLLVYFIAYRSLHYNIHIIKTILYMQANSAILFVTYFLTLTRPSRFFN